MANSAWGTQAELDALHGCFNHSHVTPQFAVSKLYIVPGAIRRKLALLSSKGCLGAAHCVLFTSVAGMKFPGKQGLAWGSLQRSSDSCSLCCSAVIHQACAVRSSLDIPSVADMAPMKATKTMKAMKAAKAMTKGGIVSELASATDMKKSDVSQLLGQLSEMGAKEVKATGKFVIPGLCMIKTRTKPATKAGKRMMFLNLLSVSFCFVSDSLMNVSVLTEHHASAPCSRVRWLRFGKEVAIKAQPAKTVVKAFAVSALKKQI